MKTIINLLEKNSVSFIIYLITLIAFIWANPNDAALIGFMLLNFVFFVGFCLDSLFEETFLKKVYKIKNKVLLMLIILMAYVLLIILGANVYVALLPFMFLGVLVVPVSTHFVGCILVAFLTFTGDSLLTEMTNYKDCLQNQTPETVVIEAIDKRDKDDVMIYDKDKGIYRFSSRIQHFSSTLGKNTLKVGDTIQIWVYDNKIVKFER